MVARKTQACSFMQTSRVRSILPQVHYGRMAQALGFDHFIVLTNDPPACDKFREAWCSDAETAAAGGGGNSSASCATTYPGCAWYTPAELEDAEGWKAARIMAVEALWLWRYHVAVEFLRRGVNVLMSDLDGVGCGCLGMGRAAPTARGTQFCQ